MRPNLFSSKSAKPVEETKAPEPTKIVISWELDAASMVVDIERGQLEVWYMDPDGRLDSYTLAAPHQFRIVGVTEKKVR